MKGVFWVVNAEEGIKYELNLALCEIMIEKEDEIIFRLTSGKEVSITHKEGMVLARKAWNKFILVNSQ